MSVVFDFNDSLNGVAPASPMLLSVNRKIYQKNACWASLAYLFIFLSSLLRSSFMSVVLSFSVSLNDTTPASPMLLPVDLKRKGK